MVDINGKSYSDIIKIKGTDKKIDLTKLAGLQRTEQNKAIFDMVDHNKDGVIDTKEAKSLQGNLLTSSNGNEKISEREANRAYGKGSNAFEALNALADQQKAFEEGKEYIEQNGKSTTRIYNSNVSEEYSYRAETDKNGVTTTYLNDGTQEIQYKDGTRRQVKGDGTVISYDKDGKKTSVMQNGNTTTFPDDNTSITENIDGETIQTVTVKDGKIIRTDFEYQDGKTIEREFSDVGDDAPLSGITVKEKKDGHNVDTKYATEEDMTNNRPSEIVTDGHNPTQKTVTKFTYNEDGTYSTETTDSAGNKTVKNFNADGTEIVKEQKPDVPTTHTVKKGESITQIVKDALAQQGIENPTPEQLKEAKKEFLELNKDLVKTYKGVKKEWHGNKFFYPDDVVKLPNFVKEDSISPDNTVVENNTVVEDNTAVEDNTVVDNNTEVVENQLTEDELSFINEFDNDDSTTINKEEFTALINDQLANLPPATIEVNKEQIQTLIDEAFAKIDAQNKNNELSQAELKQNFNTIVSELAGEINALEEQAFNNNDMVDDTKVDDNPAQDNTKPKSTLTQEEVNAKIEGLKPGESYSYQLNTSVSWGSGSSYESKPITWTKNEDGTFTKTVPDFVHAGGRRLANNYSTTYAADRKTVLSQEQTPEGLSHMKELVQTKHFEDGKATHLSTNLSNLDKKLIKNALNSASPAVKLMSSLKQQSPALQAKFSSQEIKNSNGETVITFKDGKFFNEKGKEISYEKAVKIVNNLEKDNELGSLMQTYKTNDAE